MGRRYQATPDLSLDTDALWTTIIHHQNTIFHTAKGLPFTYTVTQLPDGTLGNEILFSRKSKSITRSTVNIAYQRVRELGEVKGPKQLGVFGASYIYALFRGIGVIRDEAGEETGGETSELPQ